MHTTPSLPSQTAPPLARVRQRLASAHVADVRGETRQRVLDAGLGERVGRGDRVAITAGSRGMGGLIPVLQGIVDAVRACGGEPFLIPAMGSHGGATAEGQTEILRRLGATEEAVGAPIQATMETRDLGASESGAHAHMDRIAAEADGIIVLGRTKTHPESDEELASGLLKMVTVGLGKQTGAQQAHSHGLWESVKAVPQITLAQARIVMGVAVVENAFRQPVVIEAVPPEYPAFLDADRRLLIIAKKHLATIPFDALDLLIVDEIGKTVSGSGMDLNVIGHWRATGKGPQTPAFRRIVALSLTDASLGNGLGIGLANFTTQRFLDAYDPHATYMNLLTAQEPGLMSTAEGLLPLALPTDRAAIETALYSALAGPEPRVCRIRNTADLETFWVSPALLDTVEHNPDLSVEAPSAPLPFDERGNLF